MTVAVLEFLPDSCCWTLPTQDHRGTGRLASSELVCVTELRLLSKWYETESQRRCLLCVTGLSAMIMTDREKTRNWQINNMQDGQERGPNIGPLHLTVDARVVMARYGLRSHELEMLGECVGGGLTAERRQQPD